MRKARHRQLQAEVETLRPRARELRRARALKRWSLLLGRAVAPGRRPTWFAWKALARLRLLENSPHTSDARRRSLRLLRIFLTREHLDQHPGLRRRVDHMLYFERLKVPARGLRFHQLASRAAAGMPAVPLAATRDLLARLDRTRQRQRRLAREAAKKIGLTLVHLEQEHLELDMAALLSQARQVVKHSGPLLAEVSTRLALSSASTERLLHLRNGGASLGHLPSGQQLASVSALLSSLGLSLRTRAGTAITVKAGVRSAAVALAPDDVRLVHGQRPGLTPHVELLEAAGEAVCLGHGPRAAASSHSARAPGAKGPARAWEMWALGQRLGPRVLGHLLGLVWLEPRWRARYRSLFEDEQAAPPSERLADLARHRVLSGLLRQRLDGVAALSARAVMDGYSASGRQRPIPGNHPGAAFWLAARQASVPVASGQGRRYLLLLPLYSAPLDVRAYVLAHMLLRRLRSRHGRGWFEERKVGPWLLQRLCASGSVGPRRLMGRLGVEELDLAAPGRNLTRAWGELGTNKE